MGDRPDPAPKKGRPVEFALLGFVQTDKNIREFTFHRIGDSRKPRMEFSVCVDLTLLHKHKVPLQEVPLLCCLLLASRIEDEAITTLTFTEDDMRSRAAEREAEQAEAKLMKRKSPQSTLTVTTELAPPPPLFDLSNGKNNGIGLGNTLQHIPSVSGRVEANSAA